jgi:hypothetical protein
VELGGARDTVQCDPTMPSVDERSASAEAMQWFMSQYAWPKDVMYHYTSQSSAESILRTRRMWATDLHAMNDPRELNFGRELIAQRVKAAIRRGRNEYRARFLKSTFRLLTGMAKQSSCFSISFSEDPALPHQWKNYAADGTGVALGWSIEETLPVVPLRMWVAYDRTKQRQLVDGLINFHLDWVADVTRERSRTPEAALLEAAESLARYLEVASLTFKPGKWQAEREFRFAFRFFAGLEPAGHVLKSRFAEGREKKYIEADFADLRLRRVIIGPRSDIQETHDKFVRLLGLTGYSGVEVVLPVVSIEKVDSAGRTP